MYHVPLGVQCIYGWSDEGGEDVDGKKGIEWRLPGHLYAGDLVMVGQFVEVCRRRVSVNAGKSGVMVMNAQEGLEYEVHVDGIRSEHVFKFKYLECVLDKSGTDRA